MAYRHVVVGTDGSASAAGAVRHAARLAAACSATLTVVTAFTRHPGETAQARRDAPAEIEWRIGDLAAAEEHAGAARRLAKEEGVDDVHVHVDEGDPAAVVIAAAEERRADLIVVGSKGMTSPARFLLGSVPNRISHHAPCDVMIVRTAP